MTVQPARSGTPVTLSTSSVYPESTAAAFEMAARLGFDGVEVMVFTDSVSQELLPLQRLVDRYSMPVRSVHAPTLLLSQRVWGSEPWTKLKRAQALAEGLDARTVVVHPPFRWQRDYARDFVSGVADLEGECDVRFAIENMFPWRTGVRGLPIYAPGWDVRDAPYSHTTLDLSHTSVSGSDAVAMADDLGDRLVHLHLADGSGKVQDEHLVPGRGDQPCAEVLGRLAARGYTGDVVVEVSTRKAATRDEREADLVESLAFAREHLAAA